MADTVTLDSEQAKRLSTHARGACWSMLEAVENATAAAPRDRALPRSAPLPLRAVLASSGQL